MDEQPIKELSEIVEKGGKHDKKVDTYVLEHITATMRTDWPYVEEPIRKHQNNVFYYTNGCLKKYLINTRPSYHN